MDEQYSCDNCGTWRTILPDGTVLICPSCEDEEFNVFDLTGKIVMKESVCPECHSEIGHLPNCSHGICVIK